MTRIEIDPFDKDSVASALRQLEAYKKSLKDKEQLLLKKLGSLGATKVRMVYAVFPDYDQTDIDVTFDVKDNVATISAKGEHVAFIEFGAGVFHNGEDGTYPLPLPGGVAKIGEYGKGHGKRHAWGYYRNGNKDDLVITHGNPPAQAFYEAELEIVRKVYDIAREVFK